MRLIRLTSKQLQGIFDCNFNSDIVIQPYSKIALHSFTSQFNRLEITINSQNDTIQYSVDGAGSVKALSLPHGTYDDSTIKQLFEIVTQNLNQSMDYTKNQLGRQWFAGMLEGRVMFQCMAGTIISPPSLPIMSFVKLVNVAQNTVYGPGAYQRNGGISSQQDAFMYFTATQCKGSGSFRAKYIADDEPTNSGFQLVYALQPPSATTTIINPASVSYGIRLVDAMQPYKITINGSETATLITPVIGDTLAIDTFGGSVYLRVYRLAGNVVHTLHTSAYDHTTNYFPIAVFVGDTVMNTIRFSSDYFYNNNNPPSVVDNTLEANNNLPTLTRIAPTLNFLQFNDVNLSLEFGYKQPRYPASGFSAPEINAVYLAENGFQLRDFSESFIIEMLNLSIDSYDALTAQRRNFLAVIPQLSTVREQVVYVAPNLVFLDLNNNSPILMRQFKSRILKEDLTPINTFGLSTLTILIKGKDEL
jgi:hypothetical protein